MLPKYEVLKVDESRILAPVYVCEFILVFAQFAIIVI